MYLTISEKVTHLTNLPVSHSSENWFEDTVYTSSDQKWTNRNPVQVYLLSIWSWHCLVTQFLEQIVWPISYFCTYIHFLWPGNVYHMYKKGSKQICGRKSCLTLISWPILSRCLFLVTCKIGLFWPMWWPNCIYYIKNSTNIKHVHYVLVRVNYYNWS